MGSSILLHTDEPEGSQPSALPPLDLHNIDFCLATSNEMNNPSTKQTLILLEDI